MPREIKIGPAEKIRDLVMSHLPGITVQPLPMAPPSLPFYAGYTYFELDRRSEFWKPLEVGKLLALHVAGDFPGCTWNCGRCAPEAAEVDRRCPILCSPIRRIPIRRS